MPMLAQDTTIIRQTLGVVGVDAGNAVTPSTGPPMSPTFGMSHDRGHYLGDVSDGSYDSEMPKTPNRK